MAAKSALIVARILITDNNETLIFSAVDNKDFYNNFLGDGTSYKRDVLEIGKEIAIEGKGYRITNIVISGSPTMIDNTDVTPYNTDLKIYVDHV